MRIAETLKMPVSEVIELNVLEIRLWYEWFRLQQETMKNGTTNNRNSRRR